MRVLLLTKADEKKLPRWKAQDGKGDQATAFVKFFGAGCRWTYYVTEFCPTRQEFFGYLLGLQSDEWCSITMDDLKRLRFWAGLPVERDRFFRPATIAECKAKRL